MVELIAKAFEKGITWLNENWVNIGTIVALVLSFRANRISQKVYSFSSKPLIECYLATYKTDSGIPFIVLVVQNHGNLTARNIAVDVSYPDGISKSRFVNDAKRLRSTPFTLAPHAKLSTPICWSKDMETVVNGKINIKAKFFYYDIDNKCHKDTTAQVGLTVDEFKLFNAVNQAKGATTNG